MRQLGSRWKQGLFKVVAKWKVDESSAISARAVSDSLTLPVIHQ